MQTCSHTSVVLCRPRVVYALAVGVVILAGLASRSDALALPLFVAKYAGDALWGLMVFLCIGLLLPSRRTVTVAGLAIVFSIIVEFIQLYHAVWIDAVRDTWFGRMTLGNTFGWGDIAAYLVGITFGAVIEWAVAKARNECRV
jgi:hypothetical protein